MNSAPSPNRSMYAASSWRWPGRDALVQQRLEQRDRLGERVRERDRLEEAPVQQRDEAGVADDRGEPLGAGAGERVGGDGVGRDGVEQAGDERAVFGLRGEALGADEFFDQVRRLVRQDSVLTRSVADSC